MDMVFERFKKGDASMRAAGEKKNGFNSRKYVISNIDFPLRLNTPPVVRSTDSEMSGFKRFSGGKSGFKEICPETRDLRKFDGILDMENVGFLNRNHILSTKIVKIFRLRRYFERRFLSRSQKHHIFFACGAKVYCTMSIARRTRKNI